MQHSFQIALDVARDELYFAALWSPVAIFFLFHVWLLAVVIHQLAVREKHSRSQVIGKGVLAGVVWLVPSLIVLFVSLAAVWSVKRGAAGTPSLMALLVFVVTNLLYVLSGWALFRWVKNPENEGLGMWARESFSNR
jgi:hypothetical protein